MRASEESQSPFDLLAECSRRAESVQRQRPQRVREWQARTDAVRLCRDFQQQGCSCRRVAKRLGISPRTLSDWNKRFARGQLQPAARGRPCHEAAWETRRDVLRTIDTEGAHLGLPTLRSLQPRVRRCQLIDLQSRYRDWHRQTVRRTITRLHWTSAGTVWAVDHSQPPAPIDAIHEAILAVRDLASGYQLAWLPVADQTAHATLEALEPLLNTYGAPLVMKSDNGSAFKSRDFASLLARWTIVHLRSPARTPAYNGACEAGIGAMKTRTRHFAERESSLDRWSSGVLQEALTQANHVHRSETDPSRSAAQRWKERSKITATARNDLKDLIRRHRKNLIVHSVPDQHPLTGDQIQRKAITQTLVAMGLLTLSRRRIHPLLKTPRLAKIS